MKGISGKTIIRKAVSSMLMVMFMMLILGDTAFSWTASRLGESFVVASPGYLNAAKAKTDSILQIAVPKQPGIVDQAVDYVKNSFSSKVSENAQKNVNVDLKKKSSGVGAQDESTQVANNYVINFDPGYIDPEIAEKAFGEYNGSDMIEQLSNGNIVSVHMEGNKAFLKVINMNNPDENIQEFALDLDDGLSRNYISGIVDLGDGKFAATVVGYNSSYIPGELYEYKNVTSIRVFDTTQNRVHEMHNMRKDYESCYRYNYGTSEYSNYGTYISNLTSIGNGYYAMGIRTYNCEGRNGVYTSSQDSFISVTNNTFDFENGRRYELDNYSRGSWSAGTYTYNYQYVGNIVGLGNGDFAVSAYEYGYENNSYSSGTRLMVMGIDGGITVNSEEYYGNVSYYDRGTGNYEYSYNYINRMESIGDGKFAVAWNSYTSSRKDGVYNYTSGIDINKYRYSDTDNSIDQYSNYNITIPDNWSYDGQKYEWSYSYLTDMKVLDDESIVVAFNEYSGSYDYSTREYSSCEDASLTVINSNGTAVDIKLGSVDGGSKSITKIATLGNGKFGVVMKETGLGQGGAESKTSIKQFSSDGTALTKKDRDKSADKTVQEQNNVKVKSRNGETDVNAKSETSKTELKSSDKNGKDSSLKVSLNSGIEGDAALGSENMLAELNARLGNEAALAALSMFVAMDGMDVMAMLSEIFKDPTDMQKKIIDTLASLLSELNELAEKDGEAEQELKRAADQFVQMAAAAIVAQAIPDLLKEGDVTSIKTLFGQLEKAKSGLLSKYNTSIKGYYDEMKKVLAKNISVLQLKNLLAKELTEKELEDLPPTEIDKLLAKIKSAEDDSFEVKYVVQQENKSREKYVTQSKKELEKEMAGCLDEFTQKLSDILSAAKEEKTAKK